MMTAAGAGDQPKGLDDELCPEKLGRFRFTFARFRPIGSVGDHGSVRVQNQADALLCGTRSRALVVRPCLLFRVAVADAPCLPTEGDAAVVRWAVRAQEGVSAACAEAERRIRTH